MAGSRDVFTGTHERAVDDKGRVVVPAEFRAQLAEGAYLGRLERNLGLWLPDAFAARVDVTGAAKDNVTTRSGWSHRRNLGHHVGGFGLSDRVRPRAVARRATGVYDPVPVAARLGGVLG